MSNFSWDELRRLHEAATPGPWRSTREGEMEGAYVECNVRLDEDGEPEGDLLAGVYTGEAGKIACCAKRHYANAALIAYTRTHLQEILERLWELGDLRNS